MAKGKVLGLQRRSRIHPTAQVSPLARLAPDVEVGPYAVIGPEVVIREGCRIGPHATVTGKTFIGPHTRIYAGAVVGVAEPAEFDTPDQPQAGELRIGAGNIIREYALLRPGRDPNRPTCLGDRNLIMGYVQVGAGCQIGNGVVITHATHLSDGVTVEDDAVISGLTEIGPGVRIGRLAMVGALTGIFADVPPYLMVAGNPPQVHGINVVGLRRHDVSPEDRATLKRAFKVLYRSDRPLAESIDELAAEFSGSPLVQHLIAFLRQSERGIVQ